MHLIEFYSQVPESYILIKAAQENNKRIIYLEASNETPDQEEETVLQKALKSAQDYFLSHGVISWDHKHKITDDQKYVIGEPIETDFPATGATIVKARLYKTNTFAQGIWENLMDDSTRYGSSIGGYTLSKNMDSGVIDQVFWDELAITNKPVNDETMGKVQLVPFDTMVKALTAGSGVDASKFTGGRALIPESLQGAEDSKKKNPRKIDNNVLKSIFSDVLNKIKDGNISGSDDLISFVMDKGYSGTVAVNVLTWLNRGLPLVNKYLRSGGNDGR